MIALRIIQGGPLGKKRADLAAGPPNPYFPRLQMLRCLPTKTLYFIHDFLLPGRRPLLGPFSAFHKSNISGREDTRLRTVVLNFPSEYKATIGTNRASGSQMTRSLNANVAGFLNHVHDLSETHAKAT